MQITNSHNEEFVDFRAIGWGCLTSCISHISLIAFTLLLLAIVGTSRLQNPATIPLWANGLPMGLGLLVYVITGYVVAHVARFSPLRQTVIFCAVYILVSALEHVMYVLSGQLFYMAFANGQSPHRHSLMPDWSSVGWTLLAIPFMLLGAKLRTRGKQDPIPQ
jgi:hypothetical protein